MCLYLVTGKSQRYNYLGIKNVFLSDINTYAHYGIRNIIAYAVYVDAIYYETYKNVNFVQEYGDGLKNYRLPE